LIVNVEGHDQLDETCVLTTFFSSLLNLFDPADQHKQDNSAKFHGSQN